MVKLARPTPLVLKDVVLEIGADDFARHVSSVAFTPSASTVTWQGMSPDASYTDVGLATWTLAITYAQDWTQATSLSRYLYANEGQTVAARFRPRTGIGPAFTANITITPGQIGGAVNAVSEATVTLGSDKPVLAAFNITNKALASNVATLTTASAHGYLVGDSVVVSGVDTTFDGVYTLTAVTSNTFSYAKTAANVTSTAATGYASKA